MYNCCTTHLITPCFDQTHLIQNPTNFSRFCCVIDSTPLCTLLSDIVVLDDEFIYMFEIEKVPFLPVVGTSRSLIFNQSVELFYIRELGVFTPFEAIF